MGKIAKERLDETIKIDKREISGQLNEEIIKEDSIKEEKFTEDIEVIEKIENKDIEDINEIEPSEEDNELEDSNYNLKKLIVILLVVIGSLSIILLLWSNGYEIVNFTFNKLSKITEQKQVEDKNEANENIISAQVDLSKIYEKVHLMANTIIIPEDGQVWGKYEITKDDLISIKDNLLGNDEYLYDELLRWVDLDFSNAVNVHNYVWDKLGGTVGKAQKLNEEKIKEIVEMLSK